MYLWHLPIVYFAHMFFINTFAVLIIVLLGSIIFGFFSRKYLEIPIIKSTHVNNVLVRNLYKNIKGVIVYYVYLDHTQLNTDDINRIEKVFNNFKNEKYNF